MTVEVDLSAVLTMEAGVSVTAGAVWTVVEVDIGVDVVVVGGTLEYRSDQTL